MNILSLPYDIRHQIYAHIFPPGRQIYIQVLGQTLRAITSTEHKLSTGLLLTCRALNEEASQYLYNHYLFNIIGTKQNCLATYEPFLETVKKHARHEVQVNAFSNGAHSSTMCISIHSGDVGTAMLQRRERGEPKTIHELENEVAATSRSSRQWVTGRSLGFTPALDVKMSYALFTLQVLVFAWCFQSGTDLILPAIGSLLVWTVVSYLRSTA